MLYPAHGLDGEPRNELLLEEGLEMVSLAGAALDPETLDRQRNGLRTLSVRERAVLALMAVGCSNLAVGERLSVSPKTVESHVGSIFAKLGLQPSASEHRRVLAILAYLQDQI